MKPIMAAMRRPRRPNFSVITAMTARVENPSGKRSGIRSGPMVGTSAPDKASVIIGDLRRSRRTAHGQSLDTQGGLAHADRHALAFLAAYPEAAVELHIVTDHGDLFQRFDAVADQGGADHRVENFSVFDHIRFRGGKHELAAGGIHLSAAEIDGVMTSLHRGDDFIPALVAAQHIW